MPPSVKAAFVRKPPRPTPRDARPRVASLHAQRTVPPAGSKEAPAAGTSLPFGCRPPKRRPARSSTPDGEPTPRVKFLVRGLINEADARPAVRSAGAGAPAADGSRRILLDVEVDGCRCVLVKKPPSLPAAGSGGAHVCLSPREREITRLIAQGYPNKAVADVLDISAWTVCTHLRRIFVKFGVSSRAAMVARFLRTESSVGTAV